MKYNELRMEADTIFSIKPSYNMSFHNEKEVGTLSWDDGVLKFEGNMDESAKLFFEYLKPYVDDYIKRGGK